MATETLLWRAVRRAAIRVLVDGLWTVIVFHPISVRYLWRYWWLRPIIIWYLPFTVFLLCNFLHFMTSALFCLLTGGGKQSVLRPSFMKFQMLVAYIHSKVMHGTELHGLHNLPKGGGLVVYFHGPFIPVDLVYLFSYVYLKLGRMIGGSVERSFHKMKFFKPLLELLGFSSDRSQFIEGLKSGQLRSVAPGGAYEAMFSKDYSLEWQSRIGFAKIAKDTGVPVVPMFTSNLQHAMPLTKFNQSDTMKEWYTLTKEPIWIPKCYLPVKLRIYLGDPLVCGKDEEPEAFAQRVKTAIENLRDKHQPPHQTYLGALRERFW